MQVMLKRKEDLIKNQKKSILQYCGINCELNRLNLPSAVQKLSEFARDSSEALAFAYGILPVGNYEKASTILMAALQAINEEEFPTTVFNIKYNLSKLASFLYFNYFGNESIEQLREKLSSIIPSNIVDKYTKAFNQRFLECVVNESHINDLGYKIVDLNNKIRDSYY